MNGKPTRRQVLQGISGTSAAALISVGGAASKRPSVRLVEAGLRYEIPEELDYVTVHSDSHPPYAVDTEGGYLLPLPWANADVSEGRPPGQIVDEEPLDNGASTHVVAPNEQTDALPIALSDRKRRTDAIELAEPHPLPPISMRWNPSGPVVTAPGVGRLEFSAQESREVALEPTAITVRTVNTNDEKHENEDIPKPLLAKKVEYDTTTIQATPVLEVADRGELEIGELGAPDRGES